MQSIKRFPLKQLTYYPVQGFGINIKQGFSVPTRYQAPYSYLYNAIGEFQDQSIEEGEMCFQWFLNNERFQVQPQLNDDLQIDCAIKESLPEDYMINYNKPAFEFLTSEINKQAISVAAAESKFSNIPQNYFFYWNPLLLSKYDNALQDRSHTQISGSQNIGKNWNLIYYNLLHRLYRNKVCKTIFLHNAEECLDMNPIELFVKELLMTFGEELTFPDHHLNKLAQEVFNHIFNIADESINEFACPTKEDRKGYEFSICVSEILRSIQELLDGKSLYYFEGIASTIKNTDSSKNHLSYIEIIRFKLEDKCKRMLIICQQDHDSVLATYQKRYYGYQFITYQFPQGSALHMLQNNCKEKKCTIQESKQIFKETGQYPGLISEFSKFYSKDQTLNEALQKFHDNQVEKIRESFLDFQEKRKSFQQDVISMSKGIAIVLRRDAKSCKLSRSFVDQRYFALIDPFRGGPLYPAVKSFYINEYKSLELFLYRVNAILNDREFADNTRELFFRDFIICYIKEFQGDLAFTNSKGEITTISLLNQKVVDLNDSKQLNKPKDEVYFFKSSLQKNSYDCAILDSKSSFYLFKIFHKIKDAKKWIEETNIQEEIMNEDIGTRFHGFVPKIEVIVVFFMVVRIESVPELEELAKEHKVGTWNAAEIGVGNKEVEIL